MPRRIYSFPKNNQHADYRLVNPHDTLKQGAWVPVAFTPEFSQVFAIRPERAEAPSPGHRPGYNVNQQGAL